MQSKRKVRKCMTETKEKKKRECLKVREKLLTEHIMKAKFKENSRKIKRTVENLRRKDGTLNRNTFWEFKRKIDPKKSVEQGCTINNNQR